MTQTLLVNIRAYRAAARALPRLLPFSIMTVALSALLWGALIWAGTVAPRLDGSAQQIVLSWLPWIVSVTATVIFVSISWIAADRAINRVRHEMPIAGPLRTLALTAFTAAIMAGIAAVTWVALSLYASRAGGSMRVADIITNGPVAQQIILGVAAVAAAVVLSRMLLLALPAVAIDENQSASMTWQATLQISQQKTVELLLAFALQALTAAAGWMAFTAITTVSPALALRLIVDGDLGLLVYGRFAVGALTFTLAVMFVAVQQVATVRLYFGQPSADWYKNEKHIDLRDSAVAGPLPAPAAPGSPSQLPPIAPAAAVLPSSPAPMQTHPSAPNAGLRRPATLGARPAPVAEQSPLPPPMPYIPEHEHSETDRDPFAALRSA
jgi:hypothetical protein